MNKRFDREKYLSIGFAGVKQTGQGKRERAPLGEHVSSSLPRWMPEHKGKFTKEGKPILRTKSEIDHIEKASNGRWKFNADSD